jgi:hypothetical protein
VFPLEDIQNKSDEVLMKMSGDAPRAWTQIERMVGLARLMRVVFYAVGGIQKLALNRHVGRDVTLLVTLVVQRQPGIGMSFRALRCAQSLPLRSAQGKL